MRLPQQLPLAQMATTWASAIEPILNSPIVNGQLLSNIALISGTTVVNHKLGRKLIGWFVVGNTISATLHDNQASNQHPELTLSLTSSAATVVNLWVF